ncbi:MAG: AAA domain-containing protein, partial [Sedimentibacter sp.]
MMENKEKLISLFKCIRELCGLKYKLITNIDKQVWYKFIDNIPKDAENIRIHDINMQDNEISNQADDKTILLEVYKPEFYSCPPLPELLNGWVKSDWRKYSSEVEIIQIDEKTEEKFIDSTERTDVFSAWKIKRDEWVKEQIRIERTRNFFTELYYNYTMLDRESESIDMMVGDGLVEENPRSDIYHPVLLKKVKMEFDSEKNVISIVDTDADIELYTVLLQDINYINHDAITKLKEQISNDELHPLDRINTPMFLKSFLHRLCSTSKFKQDYNTEVSSDDKLIMSLRPVFFIKKRDGGVFNAIDDIINDIADNGVESGPLIDIIGGNKVDEKSDDNKDLLSSINGEDEEVLLCKDANEEQLEIAQRIENYNAVLVQGPPGTGKTHTIANLIGHFLSQGKSILVTSHTKKALNVLIDKVPKQLQSLCVSLLEDNNKDMERSIDGITEIISTHSTFELKETVDKLKIERDKVLKELTEIRKRITGITYKEYQSIIYDGKGYSVKEASIFVNENSDALSMIPGNVKLYRPLPVSLGDLDILYHTNEVINANEEIELKYDLPNPELLIDPYNFKRNINK